MTARNGRTRVTAITTLMLSSLWLSSSMALVFGADGVGKDDAAAEPSPAVRPEDSPTKEAEQLYREKIHPLLRARCANCHGALKQKASLRLDAIQLIRQGGSGGPAVEAGKPEESLLLDAVLARNGVSRMPPEGEHLSAEQIEAITRWIAAGAPGADEPIPEDPAKHWSFQPVVRPEPPAVQPGQSHHPIDRFLASSLAQSSLAQPGLAPLGEAQKETLLRRVYLDLIGLPPTIEEQTAFLADTRPDAFERVVDALLARPQYGERWGRHWMDVWRYSDWDGYGTEVRESQPHIWRWRDWIVESLNGDRPYDEMIVSMLAADEAHPGNESELRATGFLVRQWFKFNRNVWLDNAVEHTGKAFLGLTFNCARCHDHFYDPILQTDYYKLRAFFEPYDVRIDPVTGMTDLEKHGLARIFDAKLAEPTYLFTRGDEARPVKDNPLPADFPGLLRTLGEAPREVTLPPVAYYPGLHPARREVELANHARLVAAERQKVLASRDALAIATRKQATLLSLPPDSPPPPEFGLPKQLLDETFDSLDTTRWSSFRGEWLAREGVLQQTESRPDGARLYLNAPAVAPASFLARTKVKIVGGTTWRSVGIGFAGRSGDAPFATAETEAPHEVGVYLSAATGGTIVSLYRRENGEIHYPPNARASLPVELGKEYEFTVAASGTLVNVALDGKVVLTFVLPEPLRAGRMSLWTYDAIAEFSGLELFELPGETRLAQKPGEPLPDLSMTGSTVGVLEQRLRAEVEQLSAQLRRQELRLSTVETQTAWTEARIKADDAAYAQPPAPAATDLARAAVKLQRAALFGQRQTEEADARQKFSAAEQAYLAQPDEKTKKALTDSTEAWKKAVEATIAARTSLATDDGDTNYAKFTPVHPASSSGRRLALARMIASPRNPLTARVAVNHLWMRHFGQPLVESVFDFGANCRKATHPELLDWLASEFVEGGWKQKSLHRLIVTSAAYRRASFAHGPEAAKWLKADPDNLRYWRFQPRRLEAEVVRDEVLAAAGTIDLTLGGEELPQEAGLTSPRRSLYFRSSKEKRMVFTYLFDGPNVNECYRRSESVTPQQALALANSPLSRTGSRSAARQVADAHPFSEATSPEAASAEASSVVTVRASRVDTAFRRLLCRAPTAEERAECLAFLSAPEAAGETSTFNGATPGNSQPSSDTEQRRLEELCHVLLNHHEFVTLR